MGANFPGATPGLYGLSHYPKVLHGARADGPDEPHDWEVMGEASFDNSRPLPVHQCRTCGIEVWQGSALHAGSGALSWDSYVPGTCAGAVVTAVMTS